MDMSNGAADAGNASAKETAGGGALWYGARAPLGGLWVRTLTKCPRKVCFGRDVVSDGGCFCAAASASPKKRNA